MPSGRYKTLTIEIPITTYEFLERICLRQNTAISSWVSRTLSAEMAKTIKQLKETGKW